MLFDRLFDKYEELIDGVLYVVEYYEPVIFPCELMYRVKLFVIQNGSKRCVLRSSSNNNIVPVSGWVEKLKEKQARLSRIRPYSETKDF